MSLPLFSSFSGFFGPLISFEHISIVLYMSCVLSIFKHLPLCFEAVNLRKAPYYFGGIMFLRLSKSRKAVLLMPGDGRVFITSAAYLKKLVDGQLSGDILVCQQLTQAADRTGSVSTDSRPKADGGFEVFQ